MTPRERLRATLAGRIPDCVPVAPDFSNMIPARLTGKPFWDLYLYRDPPIWEAYIAAAKYFDIDSLMDGYFPLVFPDETPPRERWPGETQRERCGGPVPAAFFLPATGGKHPRMIPAQPGLGRIPQKNLSFALTAPAPLGKKTVKGVSAGFTRRSPIARLGKRHWGRFSCAESQHVCGSACHCGKGGR
jgi:hypothetical protein